MNIPHICKCRDQLNTPTVFRAMNICKERCDTDQAYPVPDPGLWRNGWQPELAKFLNLQQSKEKIDELNNEDPANAIFVAPYAKYMPDAVSDERPQFTCYLAHHHCHFVSEPVKKSAFQRVNEFQSNPKRELFIHSRVETD